MKLDWFKSPRSRETKVPMQGRIPSEPFAPERSSGLVSYPPPEQWDDWTEYESTEWPNKVERHYSLVPTICFNCEAGCGLLAYVDKETLQIRKFEGNPYHPASRGRNCAKGPATINQVNDSERILYPMRRTGDRGSGKWERVSWDTVLDDLAARMRQAIVEERKTEIVYHVGRPGEDGYMDRVLPAWGVDGHNSHTNVCSAGARAGYSFWMGNDRPSPDFAHARFILLISAHLETGHYFNPHAQRIVEAKMAGAKIAVLDPRLSNTASNADYWLPTWPGSEGAVLLAMANVILQEERYNAEFLRRWVNWEEYLREEHPDGPVTFERFVQILKETYARYTPDFAAQESRIPAEQIVQIAREIGAAGSAFSAHIWRAAAAGNLGGWQIARALFLLSVLTGSVATEGGTAPNLWNKFIPIPWRKPPPHKVWNELLWPKEYPLSHHEMSMLLPHLLKEGRGKLEVYFTRVYNPVWTNPDGFTWMEMLKDERKIKLHACLTPTWSETAWFADYVLPMGHGPERHDTISYETQAGQWLGFRQPVVRVARERRGEHFDATYEANPGEVWEEDEFWIELSWRIDPDGSLGIRQYFESPYQHGAKLTIDEYYRWMFENSVPGLPEAAAAEGLTPLEYMRRYTAFEVKSESYGDHEQEVAAAELEGAKVDPESGVIVTDRPAQPKEAKPGIGVTPDATRRPIGVMVDGVARAGFPTPSRKLEFFSRTVKEWGWPEEAIPTYSPSHVRAATIDSAKGEFVLLPTFRLPTLIHTRSGNSKWLNEISHSNPVWMHTFDARRLRVETGDLVKVSTEIGHYVARAWVTEAIMPGVVACSHHLGRWRLAEHEGMERWSSAVVELTQQPSTHGEGTLWRMRQLHGIRPWHSDDPDSERVWWEDPGVHQNLTFPVHPDPISGQHCWHQKVHVERAGPEDRYGDIVVDTAKSFEIYRQWLALARPAPGPDGSRRPFWLFRPYRPAAAAYQMSGEPPGR
ncbi:MAG: molybdopterin-dependent oxidoreductase [Dehalococcoidia bacterium]